MQPHCEGRSDGCGLLVQDSPESEGMSKAPVKVVRPVKSRGLCVMFWIVLKEREMRYGRVRPKLQPTLSETEVPLNVVERIARVQNVHGARKMGCVRGSYILRLVSCEAFIIQRVCRRPGAGRATQ